MLHANDGFSLLEVMVATTVLSVGVISLAQLTVMTRESMARGRAATSAQLLAAEKMEALRALPFSVDALGHDVTAPGLAPSPPGALAVNVDGYCERLDGRGRMLPADDAAAAVFVRRWSIEPLAASPDRAVVIQVLVAWPPAGETRLMTVRARKAY